MRRDGELRIAYSLRGALHRRRRWLTLIQGAGLRQQRLGSGSRQAGESLPARAGRQPRQWAQRPGPRSLKIADMVRDVAAVLDDAGVRRSSVLGASLGGMVAQELAVRYPGRVSRLVFACTTPGWPFASPMPAVLRSCHRRFAPCLPRQPLPPPGSCLLIGDLMPALRSGEVPAVSPNGPGRSVRCVRSREPAAAGRADGRTEPGSAATAR